MSSHSRYRHVVILRDIDPDGPWWIAHEFPERAVDDWCVWSWDCTPCMLHLIAAARTFGTHQAETFTVHSTTSRTICSVADVLRDALAWREANGYPDIFNERNAWPT